MTKKMYIHITLISVIIGFMLAVQYNTVQHPKERDTRDVWEIRQDLSLEKQRHSELLTLIRESTEVVNKYEDAEFDNPEMVLAQTVADLKKQAGMLAVTGPGITMTIEPAPELVQFGYEVKPISPDLLIRLVNEMYRFNAQHVEIDGQRLNYSTAIRDLNGNTSINSLPINNTFVEIKVITNNIEQAEKMYNHLLASSFRDEFYIDNLSLTIQEVDASLTIDTTLEMSNYSVLKEKEE